jgi:hypothetical protein
MAGSSIDGTTSIGEAPVAEAIDAREGRQAAPVVTAAKSAWDLRDRGWYNIPGGLSQGWDLVKTGMRTTAAAMHTAYESGADGVQRFVGGFAGETAGQVLTDHFYRIPGRIANAFVTFHFGLAEGAGEVAARAAENAVPGSAALAGAAAGSQLVSSVAQDPGAAARKVIDAARKVIDDELGSSHDIGQAAMDGNLEPLGDVTGQRGVYAGLSAVAYEALLAKGAGALARGAAAENSVPPVSRGLEIIDDINALPKLTDRVTGLRVLIRDDLTRPFGLREPLVLREVPHSIARGNRSSYHSIEGKSYEVVRQNQVDVGTDIHAYRARLNALLEELERAARLANRR